VRKVYVDGIAIDRYVLGDHGNDLVLDRLQQLWRDLCPVVDEDELKPLFGNRTAGG
jgi:hypothetical protein